MVNIDHTNTSPEHALGFIVGRADGALGGVRGHEVTHLREALKDIATRARAVVEHSDVAAEAAISSRIDAVRADHGDEVADAIERDARTAE